jgi:hypothetical protein
LSVRRQGPQSAEPWVCLRAGREVPDTQASAAKPAPDAARSANSGLSGHLLGLLVALDDGCVVGCHQRIELGKLG